MEKDGERRGKWSEREEKVKKICDFARFEGVSVCLGACWLCRGHRRLGPSPRPSILRRQNAVPPAGRRVKDLH